MPVKSTMHLTDTNPIQMQLVTTMTVAEWKEVYTYINNNMDKSAENYWYPANQINRSINDLLRQINVQFSFFKTEPTKEKDDV